jgi:hypothetical protein
VVRTDVSEERIASNFRAGELRLEYSEQVDATGRESRAFSIYRKGGVVVEFSVYNATISI